MATTPARRSLCGSALINHRPRKRLGQHFLHDPLVIERIVKAIAPAHGQRLIEIGPGLGALTLPLLRAAGRLEAIELDRDLIPELQTRCRGAGELHVHQADALKIDFAALRGRGQRLRVVGNLPYNISTPLLFRLIDQAEHLDDMLFMLQREVVDRLAAQPGSADYGRLSVMVQYRCRVEALFGVGPGAFRPPPKVASALVRLRAYRQAPLELRDAARFENLVKQAFSQRRKTLRRSLKGLLSEQAIAAAGVDPGARPQTLSLTQFAALSNSVNL